jgi:hypothetical protein
MHGSGGPSENYGPLKRQSFQRNVKPADLEPSDEMDIYERMFYFFSL